MPRVGVGTWMTVGLDAYNVVSRALEAGLRLSLAQADAEAGERDYAQLERRARGRLHPEHAIVLHARGAAGSPIILTTAGSPPAPAQVR